MAKAKTALPILGCSALAALLAAPAARAEWRFVPGVDLRETYTDNVNQAPAGQAHGSFVSTLTPGFTLTDDTPRVQFRMTFAQHLYLYSGERRDGNDRANRELNANLKARLVSDVLFLDATAAITQRAASAFGPQVSNSTYSNANQNEIRTYRVSPYLREAFGTLAQGELRYSHDRLSTDSTGLGQSDADTLSAFLASGPSFRKIGWNLAGSRQVISDTLAAKSTISTYNATLRYLMSDQFNMNVNGGYDKYDYNALGGATQGASWSGGFQWTPSSRTSVQANAGHRFYGPSYMLSIQHRSRGTVWNISYDDSVTNTRSQFILPSAVNTAALLDHLFATSMPDPVARAAAIQAYIAATGLPASLPNAINYFSNRYQLQKQFMASTAIELAHSSAVINVFRTQREALSNVNVDSNLLGSQNSALNDNTDQTGINASLNYKLGPRTQSTLSATAYRIKSVTTGRVDNNRQLSFFLTRQFAQKLSGIAEVRRIRGTSFGTDARPYTENAVAVGLAMKF